MKVNPLPAYAFNLSYATKLVGDVPDELMAQRPANLPNHPAWVIGHLANTCNFAGSLMGVENTGPQGWQELFGNSSKPDADRSKYPSKAVLIEALKQGHAKVAAAFESITPEALEAQTPVERMRASYPTVGDTLGFILGAHEAMHLGQLSAWRRVMGLGSVF